MKNILIRFLLTHHAPVKECSEKTRKWVKAWEETWTGIFREYPKEHYHAGCKNVKAGGLMLYSTCTFDGRENEGSIEYLKNAYPEFEILEIAPYEGFEKGIPELTKSKDKEYEKTVRIFPHKMKGEGH